MEVRKGYKQTEVGEIPEDWDVKKLGVISNVKTGPFGSALHERDYVEDGTPIITVEHLGEQGVVHTNLPMVSDSDKKRLAAYSLQPDDIVFSRVGSVDRNSLIRKKENGWLFSGRLLRIRINEKNVYPSFLSYYFHFEPTKQRIRTVAVGQTMASLNTKILNDVQVAFPPTKAEQTAIAAALSDVDALIQSLEKLIAKKRNIKQGAMQELLKPKEGWVTEYLGELFHLSAGRPKSAVLSESGRFIVMDMGSVSSVGKTLMSKRTDLEENVLKLGDLVMPKDDIGGGQIIGKVAFIEVDNYYVLGDHVYRLQKISSRIEPLFFYFLINSKYVNLELRKKVAGSAQLGLGRASVLEQPVTFPDEPDEQTRIATILSDMDAEISALETKLVKYKQIKQGMMQELLTGKTRLV